VAPPGPHLPAHRLDRAGVYILFPVVGPSSRSAPTATASRWATSGRRWVPFDLTPSPTAVRRRHPPQLHAQPAHGVGARAVSCTRGRGRRWLRWDGTFRLVCTLSATLGFGYHYGVDLYAGVVLTLTLESALARPRPRLGLVRVASRRRWRRAAGRVAAELSVLAVEIAEYPIVSAPLLLGVPALFAYGYWRTFYRAAASSRFAHLSLPQDAPTAR
ncbi:hypothetical protein GS444_19210, partial [Rhodococcus hoagii]|nr:hypothetical protein [Prescottella equi]